MILGLDRFARPEHLRWAGAVVAVAVLALRGNVLLPPDASSEATMDKYWGADAWRVNEQINDTRVAPYHRDSVHPLFSLVAVSTTTVGKTLIGCSDLQCGHAVYRSIFAFLGLLSFYLFIQTFSSHLVALGSCVVLVSTAAWKVWVSVPETFLFGFATIFLCLAMFARLRSERAAIAGVVVAFAGTLTNGLVGLLAVWDRVRDVRRAAPLLFKAGLTLAALAALQQAAFSTSTPFFDVLALRKEQNFVWLDGHYTKREQIDGSLGARVADFLVTGFVHAPVRQVGEQVSSIVETQRFFGSLSAFASFSRSGKSLAIRYCFSAGLALALALAVAVAGTRAVLASARPGGGSVESVPPAQRYTAVLFVFLAFQLALHSVYGDIPFLYSFHFTPLFVAIAALAYGSRWPLPYLLASIFATYCFSSVNYRVLEVVFGHAVLE